jgi:hypothetical protein
MLESLVVVVSFLYNCRHLINCMLHAMYVVCALLCSAVLCSALLSTALTSALLCSVLHYRHRHVHQDHPR